MNKIDKEKIKKIVNDETKILKIIKKLMKYPKWKSVIQYLYDDKIIGKRFIKLYNKLDNNVEKLYFYIIKKLNEKK